MPPDYNHKGERWSAEDDRKAEFWRRFGPPEANYALGGKPPLTPKQAAAERRRPPETTTPEQRELQQLDEQHDENWLLHLLPPSLSREEKLGVGEESLRCRWRCSSTVKAQSPAANSGQRKMHCWLRGWAHAPMEEYIAARNSGLADEVLSRGDDKEFTNAATRKVVKAFLERAHNEGIASDEDFLSRMKVLGALPPEYTDVNGEWVAPVADLANDAWALDTPQRMGRNMRPEIS